MTVETDLDRAQYATNATTGPWTVPFYFLANNELDVTYTSSSGVDTTLTLDVDFSVVGAGNPDGGTVTTTQAYAAGGAITILRDMDLVQETEYVDGDGFPANAHERALDRLTMIAQQLREMFSRAIRFPSSYSGSTDVGDVATRKGKLLGFDAITGAITWITAASGSALDLAALLAGSLGGSNVGIADSGGWYQATNTEATLTEIASLSLSTNILSFIPSAQWAAILNGTSTYDATAALQTAVNKAASVFIPGRINVTSQVNIPTTCGELVGRDMYTCFINKQFNGDALKIDTPGFKMRKFGIVGNGATYTGGGVRPRGYNILIEHCRITDTADCPIIVEPAVGSNALAATYLRVDSCFLLPTNVATTYAARCTGIDDAIRPTVRVFTNISGGGPLIDFSGMNYAVLTHSLGTIVKFSANSSKVVLQSNRFTNTVNLSVFGTDHVIDANEWGFDAGHNITIDSTSSNVYWGSSNNIVINGSTLQSPIDGYAAGASQNPNNVHSNLSSFTFLWTGSVTNPTLGNSTTYSYYQQAGRRCYATFGLVRGSTATLGSGTYSFQLPFKAHVTSTGTARIKSSASTYYSATVIVQGGSNVCTMYIDTLTSAFNDASIAFSTGATIDATIDFLISPT